MGAEKLIPQASAKECQPEQEADPADTEKCEASENGTKCVRNLCKCAHKQACLLMSTSSSYTTRACLCAVCVSESFEKSAGYWLIIQQHACPVAHYIKTEKLWNTAC